MSDTNTTIKGVKPGYKTTEFWLTLLANILLAAVTYLETIDAVWAAIGVITLNSIYSITRMGVKASADKAAKAVPMLLVAFSLLMLHSCSLPKLPPITGKAYYRDADTGAKAGIKFHNGSSSPFLRIPIKNEAGDNAGLIDIHAGK